MEIGDTQVYEAKHETANNKKKNEEKITSIIFFSLSFIFLFFTYKFCKIYQIFHYTRCNTPKRVSRQQGLFLRHCAGSFFRRSFAVLGSRWGAVVPSFTGARFELQTSRSRDGCVTIRPTGRFSVKYAF